MCAVTHPSLPSDLVVGLKNLDIGCHGVATRIVSLLGQFAC